jgi:hypothetical protein
MLRYVNGDIFEVLTKAEGKSVICPHIVNDWKLWGSGFVIPLAAHFPEARSRYFEQQLTLGNCEIVGVGGNIYIANMVGQHGVKGPKNPIPINYDALRSCMTIVRDKALSMPGCEIWAPKFGSERAGGDWTVIEGMIKELWTDAGIPVTVYIYP